MDSDLATARGHARANFALNHCQASVGLNSVKFLPWKSVRDIFTDCIIGGWMVLGLLLGLLELKAVSFLGRSVVSWRQSLLACVVVHLVCRDHALFVCALLGPQWASRGRL